MSDSINTQRDDNELVEGADRGVDSGDARNVVLEVALGGIGREVEANAGQEVVEELVTGEAGVGGHIDQVRVLAGLRVGLDGAHARIIAMDMP